MKKSQNDLKTYLPLTLPNGLRVLIVQNRETQKSAAALAVNVGHFSDPDHRQGLAHFLEHMLFLGTKTYPDGREYQRFINNYGGSNNGWTGTEHSCFFFDIQHQQFEAALDRFSQFFSCPLLLAENIKAERNNIDAEYKLKIRDDIRRIYDVHKETMNPAHPFAKFSVGNKETLADRKDEDLRATLVDFFNKYYVASAMTLVVEGPQSTAQLEQWVSAKFSAIAEGKVLASLDNVPLYLPEHLQKYIIAKPIQQDRQLIITFAMPCIDHLYKSKPESLLAYLIGHEGKNSLLSFLKQKEWALSLIAGTGINGYNFRDFNVSIPLTELGMEHTEEIITALFSYIGLLKEQPLAPFYYEEKKSIAELSFHYQEKLNPIDSVCQLAMNMQHYPCEHYIFGDYIMEGTNDEQLGYLLSHLTADNMRIFMLDPKCQPHKISYWYQVPYQVLTIAPETIEKWQTCQPNSALALPEKNQYIVDNPVVFSLLDPPELDYDDNTDDESSDPHTPRTTYLAPVTTIPQRIEQSSGLTVWFKQDMTFHVPKGYIYIKIDSPITIKDSSNIAMTRLFVDLFMHAVVEQHYNAELAGIHYHLHPHQGGITLQLSGISDRQEILLTELLTELNQFTCDESEFLLIKKQLITYWQSNENSKAISQLFSKLSSIIQPKNPSAAELIDTLKSINFAKFNQYSKKILNKIAIEAFIHGNWRPQEAHSITAEIKSGFASKFHERNMVKVPIIDIRGKGDIILPLHIPEQEQATLIYYPLPSREISTAVKSMILSQLLSPLFFNRMRTEKQYGYLVGVSYIPINRYPGIAFYVQSPHIEAENLTLAINKFINTCHSDIAAMDQQAWLSLQQSFVGQLQELDTTLRIRSQRFWSAICNKERSFNIQNELLKDIPAVSQQDIIDFIDDYFTIEPKIKKIYRDRFTLITAPTLIRRRIKNRTDVNIQDFEKMAKIVLNNCSTKF